ncbi:MAG: BON domain-containing protein [Desulfovibrionaceae bacterium]|nr:BON domain-containing protein [Desulfovibrionaceae bacterium]
MNRLLLFLIIPWLLGGCAVTAPYAIMDDKRLLDTMSNDKAIATSIKTALVEKSISSGMSLAVYCYYRNVYIVGEIPEYMKETVVEIAQREHPRSITTHFFTHQKSAESDFLLATRLRAKLIEKPGLSSTRVDTEVNAGRVVLLGVVGSESEKRLAIQTAKRVDGVRSVVSYLMLPPKPGEHDK